MSIPVSSDNLANVAAHYDAAILITLPENGYAKLLTVDPEIGPDGTITVMGPSASMAANVGRDPHVTLVWQPRVHHGWTLIADGKGTITHGSDAPPALIVTPESAMLHRPSRHKDGPELPV
ncbi:MAG: hypothetical protein ACTHW1_04330 [Ancrocorticia sp.]|uniref:hypothetical protein n=1 Tax=Ancrocorticia sp. TaxID=2593684 RepID=UPI003F915B24